MPARDSIPPPADPSRPARLFWAAMLDAPANAFADTECARVAAAVDRVRWTAAGNRHLTLCFLGDTTVAAGLASAAALRVPLTALAPFSVPLHAADWFPSPGHPVVLALPVTVAAPLRVLASAVMEAAADAGFPRDQRPYRGHVTLARIGRQGRARPTLLPSAATAKLHIGRVVLCESVPGDAGRHYETVLSLPLGG